ncbi:MAG: ABC transporter permease [Clostridia bacterium]|nr:ABC transporter permease [Clostridia bacterium]
MKLRDAAAMALCSLRCSMVKTLLTILGLGVGVASVLTVQALGAAGERQVEAEIARMGVNKVWVTPEDADTLTAADVLAAGEAAQLPACAGACTADVVSLGGQAVGAQVAGYDPAMQTVHGGEVLQGRTFTQEDFTRGNTVCLVNPSLRDALGGDVLGQRITVGGRRLMVVGVIDGLALPMMSLGGHMVALPLKTWEDTFGNSAAQMTLSIPPGRSANEVKAAVLQALGEGFRADTLEKEIDAARQIVRIFVMVLTCVAAVCMLTGAIGVMNVLMISVRERRREIGLIKALGGTSGQVAALFLLEALLYALLGGLLGLLLGAGLVCLFGAWMNLEARLTPRDTLPVVLAAAAMGVAFGVAPALRAAGMQVVQALRCE